VRGATAYRRHPQHAPHAYGVDQLWNAPGADT
jgi:hypothetical protein